MAAFFNTAGMSINLDHVNYVDFERDGDDKISGCKIHFSDSSEHDWLRIDADEAQQLFEYLKKATVQGR
jgi:hypothetical protein